MRTSIYYLVLTLFLLGSLPAIADQERLPNLLENEHQLSMAFETPHTKWAKPYAGGKTRVLFFVSWKQGGSIGRETIELMQRFDLEADIAYYMIDSNCLLGDNNPRPYVTADAGTQRTLRLLKNKYDVIYFNQVALNSLPTLVQQAIKQQISSGAGFVVIGDTEEVPIANAKPTLLGSGLQETAKCFTVGKGRCVLLPPRKSVEYTVGWRVALDYQFAAQGRALLWAAAKGPKIELELKLPADTIERHDLLAQQVKLNWNKPLPNSEVEVSVRRQDGKRLELGKAELSDSGSAAFELPILRAGRHHVIAIARSEQGVVNWQTSSFEVTSPTRVQSLKLEQDWAEIGESINGAVLVDGKVSSNDKLWVRLVDDYDRTIAQQEISIESNGNSAFSFPIEAWMPMLLRVEGVLEDSSGEVSSAYTFARVTKRHRDQFNFILWNYPDGDLAPYGMKSFAENGVTAVLQGGSPPLSLAASELSFVPYASSFRMSSHTVTAMLEEDGTMNGGCIHNPEVMKKWLNSTVERQHESRKHGVFVYSLGDENAVRASCLDDHCLHAYREYLKRIYGDVGKLNESWGSDYASFEVVTLLEGELPAADAPKWFQRFFAQRLQKNLTDNEGSHQIVHGDKNDELLALQAENFPRWYDRQAFQCDNYVQWCKQFKEAFRKLDPQALTGFEGTDSFSLRRLTTRSRQGGDLDSFVRELDYFGPYRGPGNEVVRSIAPPMFPMGNWFGYSMDKEVLLKHYWGQITNCMNAVQWWRWDNLHGYHGFLSPTFSPFPGVQEFIDDTQVVRDGLGTLLMHSAMHDDSVAMLYSMPSTHIAHFDGNRSYGKSKRDHDLWHKALHDSGVQFRYVTDRMLRLGEFDADKYKVLILPLSLAIGPEEAQVIREFVRSGGTLLADVRPGIYDSHCKQIETGTLDDVFGIQRSGKQDAVELDRLAIQGEIEGQPIEMRWGNWFGKDIYPQMKVDPTVTVTTGKALGQAYPIHYWVGLKHPICIVNEFGKGRAVLLNFPVYSAPFQPLLENVLASAEVTAEVKVRTPAGERINGLEVTRWQNGEGQLLGLLGTYEGDVVVELPEQQHVYDLRRRENVGRVSEFQIQVVPHRAQFFAVLPRVAAQPEIELVQHAVTGAMLQGTIRLPYTDSKRAIRITAKNPSGETVGWFNRTLIVDAQPQSFEFPLAYNDLVGEWTIEAHNLLDDHTAIHRLAVSQGKK